MTRGHFKAKCWGFCLHFLFCLHLLILMVAWSDTRQACAVCRVTSSASQPQEFAEWTLHKLIFDPAAAQGLSPAVNEFSQSLLCQSLIHLCNISLGFWLSMTNSQHFINTHPGLDPRSAGARRQRLSVMAARGAGSTAIVYCLSSQEAYLKA